MANLAVLCVCFPCTIAYWIVGNAVNAMCNLVHTDVSEYEQCESAECEAAHVI